MVAFNKNAQKTHLIFHYVTVMFIRTETQFWASPHIHRTKICRILPSVRRELHNVIYRRR